MTQSVLLQEDNKPKKLRANQHEEYIRFTIISTILPIIGIILGIVYLTKDKRLDRKLGEHLLAISVLFLIIWVSAYSIFAQHLFTTSSQSTAVTQQAVTNAYNNLAISVNDSKRESDITSLQTQLEAFFSQNGYYPTLASLNDPSWRSANMPSLDDTALMDPNGASSTLVSSPQADVYAYQPIPVGCDNAGHGQCQNYTLTATLESGKLYQKKSSN